MRYTAGLAALMPMLVAARADTEIDVGTILGYVLVGIVVGILARLLVPGEDPMGVVGTIVVGVVGAVVGGWLAGTLFEETAGVDWIASILVAAVLVLLIRMSFRGRAV
jgi:uncharacterized membrane protein YeaQ/YmgE (transglycosylase-associated protein family)